MLAGILAESQNTKKEGTLEKDMRYVKKLTIKASERRQWGHSGAFFSFEHMSQLFLALLLLTLSKGMFAGMETLERRSVARTARASKINGFVIIVKGF